MRVQKSGTPADISIMGSKRATRRRLLVLLACLWLAGCGGGFPGGLPAGFINQTQHSDTELWAIWKTAQQDLAQEVDLNPLQQSLYDAPADIRPGDPRALSAMPHQLLVAAQPDVASTVLFGVTGVQRPDPTGLIACPAPCNVRFAAAYSLYPRQITKYAASWEFQSDNFSSILKYEFENQILAELGYSLRWR
ncbi:MAG: hypothetical protein DMG87_10565 [Acidobacteria bacterium]|nr:MAG: hypothetical protein DMG87_10565 [Acidobacteriota bacterium]